MRFQKNLVCAIASKPVWGLSFLGLALAGCASSTPHFYSLGPKPMKVVAENKPVGPVKVFLPYVPLSLDRDVMVRRVGKYELTLNPHASWSEPLGAQIAATFVQDLSHALPDELIYAQNNIVSEKAKIGIDLTVNAFSLDEKGYALIEGLTSFTVKDEKGKKLFAKTRRFSWKSKRYADKGPQYETDILSEGLAAWAADTASAIVTYGQAGKGAEEEARLKQNEEEAEQAEKEMRQSEEISSATAKLAQTQRKIEQKKGKKALAGE